jgi:chromosome segregation ATPase
VRQPIKKAPLTTALLAVFGMNLATLPSLAITEEFQAALESERYEPRQKPLDLSRIAAEEMQKEKSRSGKKSQAQPTTLKVTTSKSRSQVSSAFNSERDIQKMNEKQEDLILENELTSAEILASEQVVVDAKSETRQLQQDIARLQRQLNNDRARASATRKSADQLQRRLNELKRTANEAQSKALKAEKEKNREERRSQALKEQLTKTEQRLKSAKQRTKDAQQTMVAAQRTNLDLTRKIKRNTEQMERERKRQKEIQHRISEEKRRSHSLRAGRLS